MRKLVVFLSVVLIASPASAQDLTITVKLDGKGVPSYVTADPDMPQAIKIDRTGVFRSRTIRCQSNKFKVVFLSSSYYVTENNINCVNNLVRFDVRTQVR